LKPVTQERYDLVLEINGCFKKVQCKTGRVRDGAIQFNTHSIQWLQGRKGQKRHYRGEIDLFLVYCEELAEAYLVPIELVGVTTARLRIQPTANNQQKRVLWAQDFRLQP